MGRRTRFERLRLLPSLVVLLMAALLVPGLALAAGGTFGDDDTSIFEADIEWLAAAGVTRGCNPPANTRFCPDDGVTRGQMAAFMRRFAAFLGAEDGVVDRADAAGRATTADSAASAGNADRLDGKHASAFVERGAIVMGHGGSGWQPLAVAPGGFQRWDGWVVANADGALVMAVEGPTSIAGEPYRIESVEICFQTIDDAHVTSVHVGTLPVGAALGVGFTDELDRYSPLGIACESVTLGDGLAAPRGASVTVTLDDPTLPVNPVWLYSMSSSWVPDGG